MSYTEQEYDAFEKKMHERYPKMFSSHFGGFAIGAGWWPIIEELCFRIQSHIDFKKEQKEKFGSLRFYYDGGDDLIDGMVRMAEAWADKSCEDCGAPGTRRGGGWVRTLCDHHEELYQKRQQAYDKEDDED